MDEARIDLRLHRAGRRRRRRWGPDFARAVSPGFDFERDLEPGGHRQPDHDAVGRVAGHRGGGPTQHVERRYGVEAVEDHFRSFDTICSATQERQDAVLALLAGAARRDGGGGRVQLQQHLPPCGAGAPAGVPTFHIEDADAVDVSTGTIRHQPIGTKREASQPTMAGRARIIGITAGASTPNNKVGETIARISTVAGWRWVESCAGRERG